jgi:hypothetical protein
LIGCLLAWLRSPWFLEGLPAASAAIAIFCVETEKYEEKDYLGKQGILSTGRKKVPGNTTRFGGGGGGHI